MALQPGQHAQVGDAYLGKLSSDPEARAQFAAAEDPAAVASAISTATGMAVGPEDIDGIAAHLTSNRKAEINSLAMQHPALAVIVLGSA